MFKLKNLLAAGALSLAAMGSASAADMAPMPLKAKPIVDVPFFFVNDNRVTFSYIFDGTDPGMFRARAGGGFDGNVRKQVYSFTHFDVWAYGTNFFTISMFKSDHNDPVAPCTAPGTIPGFIGGGAAAGCAGSTEIYGLVRSTFGFNQIFNTKAFTMGPLNNVSFEIGADANSQNTFLAPAKRDFVAGLQFAFDLPYKGFFNVAPLMYYEFSNHNSFIQCGLFGAGTPGVTCTPDGNTKYNPTWAVEINYYMDLGFLPPSMDYFSVSGRFGFYGPKGNQNAPLGVASGGTATKVEINSEPIRLTFDASKLVWGPKYAHFLDLWVAYRYWDNKFGLDAKAAPGVCTVGGVSTKSCKEESLYAGVTLKF